MERGERFDRSRRPDDGQSHEPEQLGQSRRKRDQSGQAQATLLSLLEDLETIIDSGTHIPFTPKVMIDRDLYLDTVDALKAAVPEAVVQAERIVRESDEIVGKARAEAERIVSLAQEERAMMISERQLLRTAEIQSRAILEAAHDEEKEIISSAEKYASDLMAQLESESVRILNEIRKAAGQMRHNAG